VWVEIGSVFFELAPGEDEEEVVGMKMEGTMRAVSSRSL
jgi:hypothetical protein